MKVRLRRPRLVPWYLPVSLIVAWEVLDKVGVFPPSQSAAPSSVIPALVQSFRVGSLAHHTALSLARLLGGVSLGAMSAVVVALVVSESSRFDNLLAPSMRFSSGVPVVLWMPFCVMLFGIGELYKVSLLGIGTFFLVQVFVLQAFRSTQRQFLEVATLLQKTWSERILHLLMPAAMPALFSSVRAALASGWIILFFVEFAASESGSEGLGWFIADARQTGRIEEEFGGLIWLALVAFGLDSVIAFWQTRILRWQDVGNHRVPETS